MEHNRLSYIAIGLVALAFLLIVSAATIEASIKRKRAWKIFQTPSGTFGFYKWSGNPCTQFFKTFNEAKLERDKVQIWSDEYDTTHSPGFSKKLKIIKE